MHSPAFDLLAGILARSEAVGAEPCVLMLDDDEVDVWARFPEREYEHVNGVRMIVSQPHVFFERASLPRPIENGDRVRRADGRTWRLSDPQDLGTGTVRCTTQLAG
ncbi:head-tail joining protein [Devosia nitrariae]|uniref:Uncharacterized protein n=1 Tax=Devosia nitrariae TaxID=2071872 RepID=A0ABQ5W0K9_9HYPH|nr:hypothetical protein [Devosia nitrariae]GLQ53600.1 hypothetical protein GCM10010862_08590 [Devosia nitrariae]